MKGCFHVARQIFDSPIWRDDPHRLKLFIYLVGIARHSKTPKRFSHFEVKRGELVTSLSDISEDNEFLFRGRIKKWSRAKVSRMLNYLVKNDYILLLADTYGTHISVCNYDTYQDLSTYKADRSETQANTTETEVNTYKNDKNGKNGKKKSVPKIKTQIPTHFHVDAQMQIWADEKGFNGTVKDQTERFVNHAQANNRKQVDWVAAWRNWMLKSKEYSKSQPNKFAGAK